MMRGVIAMVVIVAAVAAAVVLAGSGAFSGPTPSPTPANSPSSQPTRTSTPAPAATPPTFRPSPSPIDTSVVAEAEVVPLRSADLATSVSGLVAAVYVRDGADVNNGQLLVKLDQSAYQDEVNSAQADVEAKTAAVVLAELQLEQLPADASQGQIELTQANLRVAESNLDLAHTRLSSAQNALAQTEVRAPFAGTIADVSIAVGEQAVAGQTVVSLGDISTWLIETTDVSELEVVRLAVGDRASLTFSALPGLTVEGTVDRIQVRGTSDDGGVVFAVAIRPDAFNSQLRWGMSATARIRPSG
jgi:RND family efflux transporter MFP subunit